MKVFNVNLSIALFLLLGLFHSGETDKDNKQKVNYCVSTDPDLNDGDLCHTLKYYMKNSSFFFKSNSVFIFNPGEHGTDYNNSLVVQNISGLVLKGQNAIINCNKQQNYFLFNNTSDLLIEGLNFSECGQKSTDETEGYATLLINNSDNVNISMVIIYKSEYQGIYFSNVLGTILIRNSNIIKSHTNRYKKLDPYPANGIYYNFCPLNTSLKILSTTFKDNRNSNLSKQDRANRHLNYPFAAGLTIVIKCPNVAVVLDNVTADNNTGGDGGNLAVIFHIPDLFKSYHFLINNSHFSNGDAIEGGGIFLSIVEPQIQGNATLTFPIAKNHTIFTIMNTNFTYNSAKYMGGALAIRQKGSKTLLYTGNVIIENCTFANNIIVKGGHGGIAINFLNFIVTQIYQFISPQFRAFVTNCTFRNNSVHNNATLSAGTSVIFVKTTSHFQLKDVLIDSNMASGILGLQSNIILAGLINVTNNKAESGAGFLLCQNAVLYLEKGVSVNITGNNARHTGGGISVESICMVSKPICFFQFVDPEPRKYTDIEIYIHDNSASFAGHNLYGGSVDDCYLIESSTHEREANQSLPVFREIFDIHPAAKEGYTYVTSPPNKVCICINDIPICNQSEYTLPKSIFPGQSFNLTVILVGLLNGSIPGYVDAHIEGNNAMFISKNNDKLQQLKYPNCTSLSYKLISNETDTNISLRMFAEQQGDMNVTEYLQQYRGLKVKVPVSKCPLGFTLDDFTCKCLQIFDELNISCNITNQEINVPWNTWIGYNNDSDSFLPFKTYLKSDYCPQHFCNTDESKVHTSLFEFNQNEQCQENRCGIMCGECVANYSVVFGNEACKKCSNNWLWMIPAYAIAGLLLIFFLTVFDVTVADGTINGLIFYANVIQANYADIFVENVKKHSFSHLLSPFIGWLSFTNGIEKCFYNGMTEYQSAWIQFAFPTYISILLAFITILSRRYAIMMRIIGNNVVKVFATLIFFSYSKIILIVINGIDSTIITTSNNEQYLVWSNNGNIRFLHGKHIPLFLVCLCLLVICIMFTLSLLFIQILERYSHKKIFWFVRKLKPLFDAYTGPYLDTTRFWTGFLLAIRTMIVLAGIYKGRLHYGANLSIITGLLFIVLCTAFVFRNGIYKQIGTQILEASLLLNLSLVFILTEYQHNKKYFGNIAILVLIGMAFATTVLVVFYHIFKKVYSIACVQKYFDQLNERVQTRWQYNSIESNDSNTYSINFRPIAAPFTEDREPLLASTRK